MKKLVVLFAAVVILPAFTQTEASAQGRLLGRIFGARPAATYSQTPIFQHSYTPIVQPSYRYTPSTTYSYRTNRVPQPVSGYGSNLHRNYMIRRAQQKSAITGIPPRNTANILWAR